MMTSDGLLRLKEDEGCRLKVYDDANGMTISRGPAGGNPTIGYGRTLAIDGLSQDEAEYLLANDIMHIGDNLLVKFPWLLNVKPVWADVAIMVMFNTGQVFPAMMEQMKQGNAVGVAEQLMDSAAARQLPARYKRMETAILAGHW